MLAQKRKIEGGEIMSIHASRTVFTSLISIVALVGAATAATAAASEPNPDALAATAQCSSGLTTLPDASSKELVEGVVYSDVYEIGDDCSTSIVSHTEVPDVKGASASAISAIAPSPQAVVYTSNVIHSSQTLQDAVNLDILRFRYAHEATVQSGTGLSYVKFTTWRMVNSWNGNLAWNHASTPSYGPYTSTYTTSAATAQASGAFHSDFLWCNLQPGQNFTLYTTLTRSPGSYSASFSQSKTCSLTHMATAKKMNTTYNQW